jgi:hypothetical protein
LGHATFATSLSTPLQMGFHIITATYNDNASLNYLSNSAVDNLTVNDVVATTTAVDTFIVTSTQSVPVSSVPFGQSVTIAAFVNPVVSGFSNATGSVAFFDGSALLGTTRLFGGLLAGSTDVVTSALSMGVHTLTAVYAGDATHAGSPSLPVVLTVGISSADSTESFASSPVVSGNTDLLTVVVQDPNNNAVSGLPSSAFAFSLSGGTSTGTFGPVTETSTPGTYATAFTAATVGTASTLTTTVDGVTLTSQPTIQVIGGTISGTVFHDFNTNGVQDSGDPGLAGQTVYLDLDGSGTLQSGDPTATTDANGDYQFTSLSDGTYTVRQVLLGGELLSAPTSGSDQATVANAASVTGQNFADVLTSIAVPLTLPPSTPFPSQGSPNADYVEALYRAILNRNADPGGLASWTSALNSGAVSRLQVVQGIRNSPENFTREVEQFYQTLLGRPADSGGLQNWVSALESGVREEQVAFDFLDSAEYLSKGDKYFVDQMYLSILGRTFDAAGEASWLSTLGDDSSGNPTHTPTLTHEQVITDFLYSTESLTRLTEGYYEVYLQRPADQGGLNGWVAALQQGTPFLTIGQQFLSSAEFYNRAASEG